MTFSELPVHHAILLTHPDRVSYAEELWKEISLISPAHRYFNQSVLDIDTARTIISFAQSPYSGEKIALISFHTATLPAQNALLKVLEEPAQTMRFILVTTNKSHLIETVLSRTRHVAVNDEGSLDQAYIFLETAPSMRMKLPYIVEMLSAQDEEGRKDREKIKSFILSLASALQTRKTEPRFITETLTIASYASDPSASGKALIEYLALLLPQTR